ncbi:MAG: hypothetical protein ACLU1S_11630, partial [Eubacterium sp.]
VAVRIIFSIAAPMDSESLISTIRFSFHNYHVYQPKVQAQSHDTSAIIFTTIIFSLSFIF